MQPPTAVESTDITDPSGGADPIMTIVAERHAKWLAEVGKCNLSKLYISTLKCSIHTLQN